MSTVQSPRHRPFLQLPQRWLVERRMRGVRERERNKRWRDVIQSDARWPASLPKTVGAARRGVFHPLNYSGTLHQTPTPIFPPSIPLHPPNKLKPRRLPTRDKTCRRVWQPDHHRLSCSPPLPPKMSHSDGRSDRSSRSNSDATFVPSAIRTRIGRWCAVLFTDFSCTMRI